VLRLLIQEKVPLTVKNYVDVNYWGDLPDDIDEDERDVIDALRRYEKSHAFGVTITPKMHEAILKGQTEFARGGAIPFGPDAARRAVQIAKQQAGRR